MTQGISGGVGGVVCGRTSSSSPEESSGRPGEGVSDRSPGTR